MFPNDMAVPAAELLPCPYRSLMIFERLLRVLKILMNDGNVVQAVSNVSVLFQFFINFQCSNLTLQGFF